MHTVWYILVALMLTAYVVLDGFDLGAGAIHLLVGQNDSERSQVLQSIGPVWDGNEVWLIAAGGTIFFAFPLLYASSFSGFYLSIHMVVWLLIGRALGIEFREQMQLSLWRSFFDVAFSAASLLLIIFFGVAFGNVIRGVPLNSDYNFFEPLWTNWRPGTNNGILDWYTVLCAVLAATALVVHGSAYLALKTEGRVQDRAHFIAALALFPSFLLTVMTLVATLDIRRELLGNYLRHPAAFLIPALVLLTYLAMVYFSAYRNDRNRFLASCFYIVFMLAGAAYALYPNLLPASTGAANSLTIYNSAAGAYSLAKGIYWWSIGMAIAVAYFVLVYWFFRGKANTEAHAYHH